MKIKTLDILFPILIFSTPFLYYHFNDLNVDTIWGLYCGKNILNGYTMYVDIVDVNPPLIFIYFTIISFLSNVINLTDINTLILTIDLLILISLILSKTILSQLEFQNQNFLKYYLYSIAIILTISISYNFGEREHFFIIFTMPYFLMLFYKDKISIDSKRIKIFIALFAALGFNLKPHFFLIFICIELTYIIYKKNILFFFRIESMIISLSAFIYLFIIFVFFKEYINDVIPLSIETYSNVFNKPINILVLNFELILFFLTIILFIYFTKNITSYSNISILSVIISSFIIYIIQQKGWSYHRLPFFVFTLIFLSHIVFYTHNNKSKYFIVLIPLIFFIPYFNHNINSSPYSKLKHILNDLPKKSTIQIITIDIAQGQPLLRSSQTWASKYPSLFMLPEIIKNKNQELEKDIFDSIYNDLIIYKPNYIIFPNKNKNFNYYDYFITKDKRLIRYYKKHYKQYKQNDYLILKRL